MYLVLHADVRCMALTLPKNHLREVDGIHSVHSLNQVLAKERKMKKDLTVDVAIIGAGTAGLYALREVRRARKSFALIDHGPLGTTCARVGCMPSKVALHCLLYTSDAADE